MYLPQNLGDGTSTLNTLSSLFSTVQKGASAISAGLDQMQKGVPTPGATPAPQPAPAPAPVPAVMPPPALTVHKVSGTNIMLVSILGGATAGAATGAMVWQEDRKKGALYGAGIGAGFGAITGLIVKQMLKA